MTQLYSYKGAYPYPLPPDLGNYQIEDFVLAPSKPDILADEAIEWNGTSWVVRKANVAEIAFKEAEIRLLRNSKLAESDLYVIRAYEQGIPVSESIVLYRQALRDITQQSGFPWDVTWPTLSTS